MSGCAARTPEETGDHELHPLGDNTTIGHADGAVRRTRHFLVVRDQEDGCIEVFAHEAATPKRASRCRDPNCP